MKKFYLDILYKNENIRTDMKGMNSVYGTTFDHSYLYNQFMPKGIFHPYQLDESISNLRVVG